MSDAEALWTAADVAEYLRVSRSWVEHAAPAGTIPSVTIGRFRRFVPAEIREFALRGRAPKPKPKPKPKGR